MDSPFTKEMKKTSARVSEKVETAHRLQKVAERPSVRRSPWDSSHGVREEGASRRGATIDGSRGFQATVGGGMREPSRQRRLNHHIGCRSIVAPRRDVGRASVRGLKPTATITASRCEARPTADRILGSIPQIPFVVFDSVADEKRQVFFLKCPIICSPSDATGMHCGSSLICFGDFHVDVRE